MKLPRGAAHRRPSLTPMIDVVFLLLIFFMLAARFGGEAALVMAPAGSGDGWSGPPRLVEFSPSAVYLNGREERLDTLADALAPLMERAEDPVVLAPVDGANTGRAVEVIGRLRDAGLTSFALVP